MVAALQAFFAAGSTLGAFLAGFTLTVVVSTDANEVCCARLFAAITSLLFVILVFLCSMGGIIFAYYEDEFVQLFTMDLTIEPDAWRIWWLSAGVKLLFGFLTSILYTALSFFVALLFLYAKGVGIAGIAFLGLTEGGLIVAFMVRYWDRGTACIRMALKSIFHSNKARHDEST